MGNYLGKPFTAARAERAGCRASSWAWWDSATQAASPAVKARKTQIAVVSATRLSACGSLNNVAAEGLRRV